MKQKIWREGDMEYYPGGVTDPNYCVLRFTAIEADIITISNTAYLFYKF